MKKNWFALLLCGALSLSLAACGGGEVPEVPEPEKPVVEEPAVTEPLPPEEPEEEVYQPPVMTWVGGFTGLEPIEVNNDYNGGYLYRDLTEDGMSVLTNCAFLTTQGEDETQEDYILRTAREVGEAEPRELTIAASEEHSVRMTYPVYLLTWQTGANEDTRVWDGFFLMTDTHTYLYAMDTAIDYHEEMQETWLWVFEQLTLVDM